MRAASVVRSTGSARGDPARGACGAGSRLAVGSAVVGVGAAWPLPPVPPIAASSVGGLLVREQVGARRSETTGRKGKCDVAVNGR